MKMFKKWFIIFLGCLFCLHIPTVQAAKIENIQFELSEEEAVLTFLHLSKGEASLIQDGLGHAILINTGHASSEAELFRMLDLFQVKKLDAVIVTREEEGYDDNLQSVFEKFIPQAVYVPASYTKNVPSLKVVKWKKESGQSFGKSLKIKVVNEESERLPSIDLSIKYGENHIFYMADYSKKTEERLMKEQLEDVNVVKMPDLTKGEVLSEKLVEHMDPQTAVFTFLKDIQYRSQFIEYLYELWIDVYFVHQMGAVSMKMNGSHYEIITFPISECK
jgi:beta-lactamase superfamily II metal-dependent hydrolase